jgi:3-methylcrotonyl-CoA carboxylase beta subunit
MTSIGTPLPPGARANAAAMATLVADLRSTVATIALGGPQASRDRHVARGKLLPRQRVDGLSIPARRSSRSANWRRTMSMARMSPAPA